MYTKIIGPHNQLRHTKRASLYLPNKKLESHKDIDIPDTEFLGLTTEKTFVADCGAAWAQARKTRRCARGRKAQAKSLWPMQRMADNAELSEKQRAGLRDIVTKVLGPGAKAQINYHIPSENKRRATGVPGLEINPLCAAQRQIGPFQLPVRHNKRSLRRELMRGADLMEEEINATRTQDGRIRTMPEVLKERRTEQAIAKRLVSLEEKEAAFQRKNGTTQAEPYILLKSLQSVKEALANEGYVVEEMKRRATLAEPGQQDHLVWIWHWEWLKRLEQARKKKAEKDKEEKQAEQKRKLIQIDLLRILLEARALFRERLTAVQQSREKVLREELELRETVRQKVLAAGTDKLALLPGNLLNRAEQRVRGPIIPNNAASVLQQLGCALVQDQPDKNRIVIRTAEGSEAKLYRDHLLISLQVAPARSHFAGVSFFFEHDPLGVSVKLPTSATPPLDPFHPIWTKYQRGLEEHPRQELWMAAYNDVLNKHSSHKLTALEKTVFFYHFLVQNRICPEEALFMTALHFRGCDRPWGHFLRAFSAQLPKYGAELVNVPYRRASTLPEITPVTSRLLLERSSSHGIKPPVVGPTAQKIESASPDDRSQLNRKAEVTEAQHEPQLSHQTPQCNTTTKESTSKTESGMSDFSRALEQSKVVGANISAAEGAAQKTHAPKARESIASRKPTPIPTPDTVEGAPCQPGPLPVEAPTHEEKRRQRRKLQEQPYPNRENEAPGR